MHVPDRDAVDARRAKSNVRDGVPAKVVTKEEKPSMALRFVPIELSAHEFGPEDPFVVAACMLQMAAVMEPVQGPVDRNV